MTAYYDGPMVREADIAIVGMAAHLPGAADLAAFWANLRDGQTSIRHLSEAELLAAGEAPERMRQRNYVPAAALLDGFADFDADFFGFSPKEAAILDPQHRQFMEVCWEALENAGHPPESFSGAISVYAGCGMGSYLYVNLCSNPDLVAETGMFLLRHTGNDKDFLATRVSHLFDLKGPSISVQTACSTSLVAVHYAAQALLNGECDMALAGGVTIELPHGRGYIFQDGEILSPDGACHAFDHRAQGTVFGSGAGAVVLRRLSDALRDGDHIWAVLKGTAVNNDGAAKAGYLAPSVDGQAKAIAEAQAVADVPAATVDYVECHGTGTRLGDPIEVAALTQAFRETTDARAFCRIGSVKTNIGHLDTAAGVAGLIKTSLALHHRQIPPSLGYEAPNPAIDFAASPFRVNDRLTDWPARATPRRAGVNALGVGGTNAHAVLEEAPARPASEESDWPFQLLVLSAKSKPALEAASARLAAHLRAHPEQPLADVAFTLKQGRHAFDKRRVIVADSHAEAAALLEGADPRRVFSHEALAAPEVVFMFPGGGAQHVGMARDLYDTEPVFRDWIDRGLAALQPRLDYDVTAIWLPAHGEEEQAAERLKKPSVQLPLILIVEIALARLYESWGVVPTALIGHSMGENTAACLAGVMSFEDCIGLVLLRGQLFDSIAPGGMVSVPLSEAALRPHLTGDLDLASVNAPGLCVVSGPDAALAALVETLAARDIETQRIAIDIPAHSRMLERILSRFEAHLRGMRLSPPTLPILSNRTGKPLTDAEATDPAYWVAHLRNTVRFADGMATLTAVRNRIYMEMGPGRALSSLAQANGVPASQVVPALRHPEQAMADDAWHIASLGRLWACGVAVDWEPIWGGARRQRVPLPGYAFQRKRYFIEPGTVAEAAPSLPKRIDDIAGWGWLPHWRAEAAACDLDVEAGETGPPQTWLVFLDDAGLAAACVERLRATGHRVTTVRVSDTFARTKDGYTLSPERGREGYDQLIRDLVARGEVPSRIAHFWLVTQAEIFRPGSSFFHRNIEQGFHALLFLAQAIADENLPRPIHLTAVTTGAAQVRVEGLAYPEKATLSGPARTIPQELPGITCTTLDVVLPRMPRRGRPVLDGLAVQVLEDLLAAPDSKIAALRGRRRYTRGVKAVALPPSTEIAEGAVMLITGGFGGIGLTLAEDLMRRRKARVLLIARHPLPDRASWPRHLANPASPTARRILALQRLEALGQVVVAVADVSNIEDMRAAVALGERRLGPIKVAIHAAGVVDDGPLLTKTPVSVEEVFAPKLHGTQVLDQLFPDGALDLLVLCASSSTVTGPAGQVDYISANDYLNAVAQSRSGGRTRVLALNWGIWSDVGMAARALADRLGERPALPVVAANLPLLDEAGFDRDGHRQFTTRLDTKRWVLDGHRTRAGQALLPGTGIIELAAEALRHEGVESFEIRDLIFFRPLEVADATPRDIRVTLARSDEGFGFSLRSAVDTQGRTGWQVNAQARLIPQATVAATIDPTAIEARCPHASTSDTGLRSPQEAHLAFGPRWRVLRRTGLGQGEGIARLALPSAFRTDLARGWLLHPALLDLATGWAMGLIAGYQPTHLWVPVSYARIRVHAPLPAEIVSWVRSAGANAADAATASFDITLAAPDGTVCMEVEGFTIHRLDGPLSLQPDPRGVEFDDASQPHPLSPTEERLLHNLSQGIRPHEGAEAFHRAVGLGLPQVIVSSLDLPTLVKQAQIVDERPVGQSFARPDLDHPYVAPRTDVERTLTGFWQDLLGVAQVGVEDDFFALGGHSLIAVRLFSMVRKAWRVDFPISVLFEAPTIARCAALISARIGPSAETTAPVRRFTHLVPMHERDGGPGTPLFMVAGMYGNVLNLRHLAQLLGGTRPFYGLQARGLQGDAPPHATLTEAAADYIVELRQVQDRGPYLLGGFSGGGLIAWEMARQLEAEGEEVAALMLLDTPLPVRPALSRQDKALMRLAKLRRGGLGFLAGWAGRRWASITEPQVAPVDEESAFHSGAVGTAFRAALPGFTLAPRHGTTVLFRPPLDCAWRLPGGRVANALQEYVYTDNALTPFAPALEVVEVPGAHDSMVLEPNVRVLAARMRVVMDRADMRAPYRAEAAE